MSQTENIYAPVDDEEFMDEALGEVERRRELERAGQIAAAIEIDLTDKGPLFLYLKGRRAEALLALSALVTADPEKPSEIIKHQMLVTEYLRAAEWVREQAHEAAIAEQTILEEYADEPPHHH